MTNIKEIEAQYPSQIKFNFDDGVSAALPRSSNIKQMRWAGSAQEFSLFVEFFGYTTKAGVQKPETGYVYKADVDTWYKLLSGVDAPDLSDDPLRRSTGRVFHQEVRNKTEYKRVF